MFFIRRKPVGGAPAPLYYNPATGMSMVIASLYGLLWILTNVGIILNKIWDESCSVLFQYLLMMSLICIFGVVVYLFLGLFRYGSDSQWFLLSILGALAALALSIFLCYGVVNIVHESGVVGINQCFACEYTNGTLVNTTCTSDTVCVESSWQVIYDVSECANATSINIDCAVSNLCIIAGPQTFWYATVTTVFYVIVLMLNTGFIFGRLIPSIIVQSHERNRMV